jgi:two-component system phosphate regulon response regulator OmpR
MMRLLLVSHAPAEHTTLLRYLGYHVIVATSADHAQALTGTHRFDVVLVSAAGVACNGFGLCAALRERLGDDVVIMLLTTDDTPLRRVTGMQLGADDVVGLPFHGDELVARIAAHGRRRTADTM